MELQCLIRFMPILMCSLNSFKKTPVGHKNYIAQKSVLFAQKIEITTLPIFLAFTTSLKEREEARSASITRIISMNLFVLAIQNSVKFLKLSIFSKRV